MNSGGYYKARRVPLVKKVGSTQLSLEITCVNFMAHNRLQILALGALINCVELKQCADNCVIMAGLSVLSSFPTALATTGKTISTSKLSTRCAALGFLASLLVTCTEGFAKHLETGDREHGEDGEERMLIGAEAHGARSAISPPRGITKSSALPDTPVKEFATPEVMAGVEAEETMTAAEGAQLVLGGHCALLLGLLVRDHDNNRCGYNLA